MIPADVEPGRRTPTDRWDRTTVLYRLAVLVVILIHALVGLPMEDCAIVDELQTSRPEVEVTLQSGGTVLARIGYFRRPDDGYDVVAGVSEAVFRSHIADVLRSAASQLDSVSRWEQFDDVRAFRPPRNEESSLPF